MKLEKTFCYINISDDLLRFSRINKELINYLSKKFKKIYILNLQSLRLFSKNKNFSINKNKKLLPKNFKIIDIKNTNHFLRFSKNKELIVIMNSLTKSLYDFKIYYLLKKINAKLVMISINSMWGTKIFVDIPLKDIFVGHKHFFKKSFYYIWRILTILNIFPKIHLLFESNKEFIKAFNSGISRKFENRFPFFKISLYRKIVHVNSNVFDTFYKNFKNKKNKLKEEKKFILYIDSPIDSEDRTSREGPVSNLVKKKYYKNLFNALNKLSYIFNKKIVISLHPNSIKIFDKTKKIFDNNKNFVVSKKRTVDLIQKSSIVLFSISSAILHAVILKKKILGLRSKYFGKYNLKIHEKNIKGINCPCIDIDQKIQISSKTINKAFRNSISSYDKLIKKRLTNQTNKPSFVEIVETLKKGRY